MTRTMTRALSIALALTSVAGCYVRNPVDHAAPAVAIPAHYATSVRTDPANASEPETRDLDHRFWEQFNDPALNALVEAALASSLDLRSASARVAQAEALANQARAARWPTVSGSASFGYGRSINPAFGSAINTMSFNASLPVAYEVDVFGRARGATEAADLDTEAGRLDRATIAISIAAQTTEAYFDLINVSRREALFREQHDVNEAFLSLLELRFREGLTNSPADVHQQRQQLAVSDAQLALIDGEVALLTQRLAAILGTTPGNARALSEARADSLPAIEDTPHPGVPADVLQMRPDIRAAQRRVEAADRRVSAAIAARLPAIRLSFTPGYNWLRVGTDMGDRNSRGFVFNLGAGLTVPLWDGGRGRATVELSEAQVEERIATLSRTVLTALIEVEGAIVQERQAKILLAQLAHQHELAEATLGSTQDRYRSGLHDYLPVLTALRAKQGLEQQKLASERQLVSARVQLLRSLGGTWPDALLRDQDEAREPLRRIEMDDVMIEDSGANP